MNFKLIIILIILSCLLFSTGCVTSKQEPQSQVQPTATLTSSIAPDFTSTPVEKHLSPETPSDTIKADQNQVNSQQTPSVTLPSQVERSSDMAGFISSSLPKVTETYVAIKKSRNALEWKKVQDQALSLQISIQDLKKTYQLSAPNPEKTAFPGLNNREQIVFLKYNQYLNDIENYAINLKNAVYYQEKGNDPQTLQTARRYQSLADQYEKQVIAGIKTIADYGNDFKYSFVDPKMVQEYRYVQHTE